VASSSRDKTVNIWNPQTWSSIRQYTGHQDVVYGLDQIDIDTIVSGSQDGTIQVWKISTGETLLNISLLSTVYTVRVLTNGFQIVAGGYLENEFISNLRIFNLKANDSVLNLIGHTSYVSSLEILNERFMASGDSDSKIIIWDLYAYLVKYNLTEHTGGVNCIKRISSNLIASADSNGLIIIWDWLKGKRIYLLTGHTGQLNLSSLDFYMDQISGCMDKTIKFWNILNGQIIQSINGETQITALAKL